MRGRLALAAMLASSLTFLVSLYLTWSYEVDGWFLTENEIAALIAVCVAGACAVALVRSDLVERLPIGRGALLLGYLACGSFPAIRASAHLPGLPESHLAFGAYLALGCGIVLLVAAAVVLSSELQPEVSFAEAGIALLGIAALVALAALPWVGTTYGSFHFGSTGIEGSAGTLAAASICLSITSTSKRTSSFLAVCALVFTVAAFVPPLGSPLLVYRYGAWLGLGLSVGFTAARIAASARCGVTPRTSRRVGLVLAPAMVVLVSLFLPWESLCYPAARGVGPLAGVCIATNGWGQSSGSAAGFLVILLAAVLLLGWIGPGLGESAVAIALLVAVRGYQLFFDSHRAYGAYVGFAGAGLLLGVALRRVRWREASARRLFARLVPVVACLACLALVLIPMFSYDLFAERIRFQVRPSTWLGVALAILGVWLLGLWLRRAARQPRNPDHLVLIPLSMLAVLTMVLIANRYLGFTWGGGIFIGLCVILAGLGWIEQRGGIERFRIPEEIWRVDRISTGEN